MASLEEVCAQQAARVRDLEIELEKVQESDRLAQQELSAVRAQSEQDRSEFEKQIEQMTTLQEELQSENSQLFSELEDAVARVQALKTEVLWIQKMVLGSAGVLLPCAVASTPPQPQPQPQPQLQPQSQLQPQPQLQKHPVPIILSLKTGQEHHFITSEPREPSQSSSLKRAASAGGLLQGPSPGALLEAFSPCRSKASRQSLASWHQGCGQQLSPAHHSPSNVPNTPSSQQAALMSPASAPRRSASAPRLCSAGHGHGIATPGAPGLDPRVLFATPQQPGHRIAVIPPPQ
eukprot:TRINITY_DN17027_c4_g1_i1.p1 TRINITY_DN17027_c4_g1~~TRINITY_DN17027_c4_g1_i1.p1  ORF type:complete len:291 (+),score=68.12 TRINITY_DN17027_c4_g1_i1:70-942(+)